MRRKKIKGKQSKLVTVPVKARSSKTHPEVHLAYITDKEQDLLIKKDLYNSLKGKPNRGPGGLPSLEGDFGSPTGQAYADPKSSYSPAGPDVSSHKASGEGGQKYTKTVSTGDGSKPVKAASTLFSLAKKSVPATWLYEGAKKIGNIFQKKAKRPTVVDTAAMEDAPFNQQKKMYDWGPQNGGGGNVTTVTQSLVTAPTADKAAGFGHQWDFKAYGANTNVAANPYDYSKAPYAKKGKLVRKYATGQEIKNFSKGKRFGPPPLKGPDPQGLQVILENSDYFKKLIG